MLGIVAFDGVRCICPSAQPPAPPPISQIRRFVENRGGARAYCSLLPPEFSAKRLRSYGRKINHQPYYTTKSLPNLTTYQTTDWTGGKKYIKGSMRENLRGSMAREDIYKVARAPITCTSPNSKRLPKYPPTNIAFPTSNYSKILQGKSS